MTTRMTKRQKQVLGFIRLYRESHFYSPSVRDVQKHFGFASPQGATCHLVALQKKGLITWTPNTARSIRILDQVSAGTEASVGKPTNQEEVAADAI